MAFLLTYSVEIDDDVYADAYQMFDCKLTAYNAFDKMVDVCLLYTSPSPRDGLLSRMPSSA